MRAKYLEIFVIGFPLLLNTALAQAPFFDWARHAGGTSSANVADEARQVALSADHNLFVVGSGYGTNLFSTNTSISVTGAAIIVAKYDLAGSLLWARSIGGTNRLLSPGRNTANAVAATPDNGCFVVGNFADSLRFGATQLAPFGTNSDYYASDAFLARFDSDGNVQWAVQIGSSNAADYANAVAADQDGNVILAGSFSGITLLGMTNLAPQAYADMFMAKFSGSGSLLWARQAATAEAEALTTDSVGNIFVAGLFNSTAFASPHTLTSAGYWDAFLAKYDSSGNLLWTRRGGGPNYDIAYGLAVDSSDGVLVTGFIQHDATFENTTITNFGANGPFVAKYASDGSLRWVKSIFGPAVTYGNAIAVDDMNSFYLTGAYLGTVDFGGISLTNPTGPNYPYYSYGYVAKYTAQGELAWVKDVPGTLGNFLNSITVDAQRNCYLVGDLAGEFIADGLALTSYGSTDLFIARLNGESPRIALARSGGRLMLSWPTNLIGYAAESRNSVTGTGTWTMLTNATSVSNSQFQVQLDANRDEQYFRLRRTGP
jgi:hypothetical protein